MEGVKRLGKIERWRLFIVRRVSKIEAVMKVAPAKKREACLRERYEVQEGDCCGCRSGGDDGGIFGCCGLALVMVWTAGRWRKAIELRV